MKINSDQKIRETALNPNESFIVQAPAGSGKTELLIQRYLRLLASVHKAPEEIMAITFTRKAAAEMRERIMDALSLANEPEPALAHKKTTWHLAKAVVKISQQQHWQLDKNPNRLRIMTIDSLTAMLNKQIPLLCGFGANVDIIEQPHALYQKAISRLLDYLNSQENEAYSALSTLLFYLDNDAEKLATLLKTLLGRREQWLPHILGHDRLMRRKILEDSLAHIVEEAIETINALFPSALKEKAIALFCFSKKQLTFDGKLEDWQGLATLLLTEKGEWRKRITKTEGFDAKSEEKTQIMALLKSLETNDTVLHALNEIRNCPAPQYTEAQWEVVNALVELLPLLAAELNVLFQEQGVIDFTEQTLGALRALGDEENPTELALHLDYQIRHLLIDEFQDTSVMQFHLIEKLIREWQPGDGRTLFIVGDPMQSIYRFRQAEVGLFLRLQEEPIQQIQLTPLQLKCNFRSEQGIVEWVNRTFESLFPASENITEGAVSYKDALAVHPTTQKQNVFFYNHQNATEETEAKTIVKTIQTIQNTYPNESIAILVRARSHLPAIISQLNEQQMAFQAIEIDPLSHYPEIQDLLSLTRALLHLNDREAWLALLRSPFCGLTLHDLHQLTYDEKDMPPWWGLKNKKDFMGFSTDGEKRLRYFIAVLSDAFTKQAEYDLSRWIEYTWLKLNGAAILKNQSDLARCNAFFRLLRKAATPFDLAEFTKTLEKAFAQTTTEPALPIQVMTIHKSKGLEFDHVWLPHLQKTNKSSDQKLLQWLERVSRDETNDLILAPIQLKEEKESKIYHYLNNIEKQKEAYERIRLLYVAATRAKKTLHLSAFTNKEALKMDYFKAEWDQHIIVGEQEKIDDEKKGTYLTRLVEVHEVNAPEKSRAPNIMNHPPMAPSEKNNLIARLTGTVIHYFLEKISQGQSYQPERAKQKLIELGMPTSAMSSSLAIIDKAIHNTLNSERGRWILKTHHLAASEYALTARLNNQLKTYIIDRTFVDENNRRWIIDYKTSDPALAKPEYIDQLNEYAERFKLIDDREIVLALYFPLHDEWLSWKYTPSCHALTKHDVL